MPQGVGECRPGLRPEGVRGASIRIPTLSGRLEFWGGYEVRGKRFSMSNREGLLERAVESTITT